MIQTTIGLDLARQAIGPGLQVERGGQETTQDRRHDAELVDVDVRALALHRQRSKGLLDEQVYDWREE